MKNYLSVKLAASLGALCLVAALPLFFQNCAKSGASDSSGSDPSSSSLACDPVYTCSTQPVDDGANDGLCYCNNSSGLSLTVQCTTPFPCGGGTPTPTPFGFTPTPFGFTPTPSPTPPSGVTCLWAGVTLQPAQTLFFYNPASQVTGETAQACFQNSMSVHCKGTVKQAGILKCYLPGSTGLYDQATDCNANPATSYGYSSCAGSTPSATPTPFPTATPAACSWVTSVGTYSIPTGQTLPFYKKKNAGAKCAKRSVLVHCKGNGVMKCLPNGATQSAKCTSDQETTYIWNTCS